MIRVLLAIVLSIVFAGGMAAQVPSTTDRVRQMMTEHLEKVFKGVDGSVDRITLSVNDHPDAKWVETIALEQAIGRGLEVSTSTADVDVEVVVKDLSTRYEALEESDSVRRIITVDIEGIVTRNELVNVVGAAAAIDTLICTRRDALASESKQHRATYGEMPESASSFWDDVLEPAIFVAAAVATVVLLFTVRSSSE